MEQVLARFVANMLRVKPRTRSHDDDEPSMRCFGLGWILLAVGDLEPGKADDAGRNAEQSWRWPKLQLLTIGSRRTVASFHRGKPTLKVEVLRNHFNTATLAKCAFFWDAVWATKYLFTAGKFNRYSGSPV
jgi:hypothetical protein